MKEICSDDGKPELITEGISKISNDKKVSEIYFIESIKLMVQILKKKERIYCFMIENYFRQIWNLKILILYYYLI